MKAASSADFRRLHKLANAAGSRFAHGVLFYDGERRLRFGEKFHAVPIRALWDTE